MSLPVIRGASAALYPYTMTLSFLTGVGEWQNGAQQRWIRQPGALVKFDLPYSGMNQAQKNTVKSAITSAKGRFDNTLSLTVGATTYTNMGLDSDEWTATEAETMTYGAPIRLSQSITQNLSPGAPGSAFPTLANGAMCTIGYAQRKRFQTVSQKVEAGPVSTFAEFAGGLTGYPTDGLMGWAPGAIKVCDTDTAALISHFLANWGRAFYFPFTDEDAVTYSLTHYASDELVVRVNGPNDSNLQIMLEANKRAKMAFTIEQGKEAGLVQTQVIPKSLTLVQITAIDGDTVYLTTTPALGGNTLTYAGNTYQAVLQSNPVEQIQAMSSQGYDIPGSLKLQIADGGFSIWNNHARPHPWRGGTITVKQVMLDIPSGVYSSNAYTWPFICDKPNIDAKGSLTVAGQARQSLTRLTVPNVPRQNRCSHDFPTTAAQRLDGLTNPTSIYWSCKYSPDLISIGGIGNTTTPNLTNADGSALTDSAGIYVTCDKSRSCGNGKATLTQGCMARQGNYAGTRAPDGDIQFDQGHRYTSHFDGDTWVSPVGWAGRSYTNPSAGTQHGFNTPNPATGSTYYNQGYGTQWVTATVLAPGGDPNSNRAEAIVCVAPVNPANILKVLVNGDEVIQGNKDVLFTYYVRSAGGRDGAVNADAIFDSHGDPHGSLCYIEVVVPSQLAAAGSILTVQVLVQFPQPVHAYPVATATPSGANTVLTFPAGIPNPDIGPGLQIFVTGNSGVPTGGYTTVGAPSYGPPGTVIIAGNWTGTGGSIFYYPQIVDSAMVDSNGSVAANPVWVLMDLLMWGPFASADFDVLSWYNAAQVCAVQIPYTDINGNAATHARYRCSLALQTSNRQSLAKAVLGVRNCAGIMLARNPATGQLQCFLEQTLADQQPSAIVGSNYNTAVSSVTAAGTTANGYLAYLFDGVGSIELGTFKLGGQSLNDTANTIAVAFQDAANQWQQDTCATIDPPGYETSGNQEIEGTAYYLGFENFDQITRRCNIDLAKALYGSLGGTPSGTELPSFRTTSKALHLVGRLGAICGINYQQLGVTMILARLLSATLQTDGEHVDLNFRLHYDQWGVDAWAQDPAAFTRQSVLSQRSGLPYPWRPAAQVWASGDAMFPGLFSPGFLLALDISSYPATLTAAGYTPVNTPQIGQPPQTPFQATTSPTGGLIRPGTYYLMVSSNGPSGPISQSVKLVVPAGTNTNTATISNIVWPSGAAAAPAAYGGTNPTTGMGYLGLPGISPYIGSSPDVNGNPTVFTFLAIAGGGVGLPDNVFQEYLIEASSIAVGGVWQDTVTAIAGGNVLTLASGSGWSTNQWQNRVLSLLYRPGALPQAPANVVVASNTAAALTMHSGLGIPSFQVGDVVTMRMSLSSITANTFGDTQLNLVAGSQVGNQYMILSGTGANQSPKTIQSHTSGLGAVLTIQGSWDVTPDATSIGIILSPTDAYSKYTNVVVNDGAAGIVTSNVAQLALTWVPAQSLFVVVSTCDAAGNCYPQRYQPGREVYVPAQSIPSAAVADGYHTITPVSGSATVDLATGLNQRLVLNATPVNLLAPINTGGAIVAGASFTLYLDQDATGARLAPTFTGGAHGFVSNTAAQVQMDGTPSTRSSITFTFHGAYWAMDYQQTGVSTS